jgi:hypothetical protein
MAPGFPPSKIAFPEEGESAGVPSVSSGCGFSGSLPISTRPDFPNRAVIPRVFLACDSVTELDEAVKDYLESD